jgi:hypothetical protein
MPLMLLAMLTKDEIMDLIAGRARCLLIPAWAGNFLEFLLVKFFTSAYLASYAMAHFPFCRTHFSAISSAAAPLHPGAAVLVVPCISKEIHTSSCHFCR